ncbi:MAG: M3 family metallopeptidase [Methylophilaceae bacterium]|nr:M3 family metallopeptidase [Methylophilaceae bacterium]
MNNKANNPLLVRNFLPLFSQIKPEHITPAIDIILDDNRRVILGIENLSEKLLWENFVEPLQKCDEKLSRAWSQVNHLNAVVNNKDLRDEYNKNFLKITNYYSEISQNEIIYKKFKQLKNSLEYKSFNDARKKVVDDELTGFKLGGVGLPTNKKKEFKKIKEELSSLTSKFEENLLDATNNFQLHVTDPMKMKGLPEDIIAMVKNNAKQKKLDGWLFTLDFPCYIPTLQYADNRELRKEMYHAYATKASDLGEPLLDNTKNINDILTLKSKLAKMLNYSDYASMSLETKMAKSSNDVTNFLYDLALKAKSFAKKDMLDLTNEASKNGIIDIEAWDIAYFSEKIKQQRFNFSDQEIKNYFPKHKVLTGLFNIVEKIYSIYITPKKADTWNNLVEFYEIKDKKNNLLGQFYLDLYARKNKRGGAWMDEAISKYKFLEESSLPVAYLTCNFSPPVNNTSSTFTHDEVITLFHEFGHGLHHLLTEIEEYSVSGIKGVEWDAVELPSQFMENFCWEWSVVQSMSEHSLTKSPMPKSLFDKLYLSKNFQSGMQTLRQVEFALFDIILHSTYDSSSNNVMGILEDIRNKIAVIKPPSWNRFPHSFAHIFSGGYAAGYYSYKWAEVLSADAYSLFEENGVISPLIGKSFKQEILGRGGSRPALDSFIAFRGREPKIDALLKHSGLN